MDYVIVYGPDLDAEVRNADWTLDTSASAVPIILEGYRREWGGISRNGLRRQLTLVPNKTTAPTSPTTPSSANSLSPTISIIVPATTDLLTTGSNKVFAQIQHEKGTYAAAVPVTSTAMWRRILRTSAGVCCTVPIENVSAVNGSKFDPNARFFLFTTSESAGTSQQIDAAAPVSLSEIDSIVVGALDLFKDGAVARALLSEPRNWHCAPVANDRACTDDKSYIYVRRLVDKVLGKIPDVRWIAPQRHVVLSYGSLMNAASRTLTLPNCNHAFAVRVKNYRRVWGPQSLMWTPLGVEVCAGCSTLMVCFETDDLAAFDSREALYTRVAVPRDCVSLHRPDPVAMALLDDDRTRIWIYDPDTTLLPDPAHPILLSYVDVVAAGLWEMAGEMGTAEFLCETKGWSVIADDRAMPRYSKAKGVVIPPEVTELVDQELAAKRRLVYISVA
eukprot:PhM_4_TR16093/c0_g1_i2/m.90112